MLHSKATAALMRLKEIDRKYKSKNKEWSDIHLSTESSINENSAATSKHSFLLKESDLTKLDVRMPEARIEQSDDETSRNNEVKERISSTIVVTIHPKFSDEVALDEREEEQNSDVSFTIATDNETISSDKENVLEELKSPTNNFVIDAEALKDRSDEEDEDDITLSEIVRTIEELTAGPQEEKKDYEKIKETAEQEEVEGEKEDEEQKKTTEKQKQEKIESMQESSTVESFISEMEETLEMNSRKTSQEDSRVSMLSKPKPQQIELVPTYTNDTFEDASSSISSTSKSKIDLDEQLDSPKTELEDDEEQNVGDSMISGVKKIEILPHGVSVRLRQNEETKQLRDKELVELVPPKVMRNTSECEVGLNKELSNYVKTIESIGDDLSEIIPVCLLKSPRPPPVEGYPGKYKRKCKRRINSARSGAVLENSKNVATAKTTRKPRTLTHRSCSAEQDDTGTTNGKSSFENSARTVFKSSSTRANQEESRFRRTLPLRQEKEDSTVTAETPDILANIEQGAESKGHSRQLRTLKNSSNNSSIEKRSCIEKKREKKANMKEKKRVKKENKVEITSLSIEISENTVSISEPSKDGATSLLRKLNKDAIEAVIRRHTNARNREMGELTRISEDQVRSRHKTYESGDAHRKKKKKSKIKETSSKCSEPRRVTNEKEDKSCRFDSRRTMKLRKQIAALKLQEERRELLNNLNRERQLENDNSSSRKAAPLLFKPLEFPNIVEFTCDDINDLESVAKNPYAGLCERLTAVKQWLKNQYLLYRDHSKLVQLINEKYVPTDLQNAKAMIRELQKETIKIR